MIRGSRVRPIPERKRDQRQYDLIQQYLSGLILNTVLKIINDLDGPYTQLTQMCSRCHWIWWRFGRNCVPLVDCQQYANFHVKPCYRRKGRAAAESEPPSVAASPRASCYVMNARSSAVATRPGRGWPNGWHGWPPRLSAFSLPATYSACGVEGGSKTGRGWYMDSIRPVKTVYKMPHSCRNAAS